MGLDQFSRDATRTDMVTPWCKRCQKVSRDNKRAHITEVKRKYREANLEKIEESARKHRVNNRLRILAKERTFRENNPHKQMTWMARIRARKIGLPCSITPEDVLRVWPADGMCPILGIPMSIGRRCQEPNSPSLDRIVPALGYVPGNIAVISARANAIKQGETDPECIRRVANWLQEQLDKRSITEE